MTRRGIRRCGCFASTSPATGTRSSPPCARRWNDFARVVRRYPEKPSPPEGITAPNARAGGNRWNLNEMSIGIEYRTPKHTSGNVTVVVSGGLPATRVWRTEAIVLQLPDIEDRPVTVWQMRGHHRPSWPVASPSGNGGFGPNSGDRVNALATRQYNGGFTDGVMRDRDNARVAGQDGRGDSRSIAPSNHPAVIGPVQQGLTLTAAA
jgi:hypothetical protein